MSILIIEDCSFKPKFSDEYIKAVLYEREAIARAECEENQWYISDWSPCYRAGYQELILLGVDEIVESADFGSYQGDSYVLARRGEEWGFLTYGWGSCSGCDSYEACRNVQDLCDLAIELRNGFHWESTPYELLVWLMSRDWATLWSYHQEEELNARKSIILALANRI